MRIQCPACDATYDLPDGAVKAGRPVRCARCATDWTPVPAAPAPEVAARASEPLRITFPSPPLRDPPPQAASPAPSLPDSPSPEPSAPEPEPEPEPALEPPRPVPQERLAPAGRVPADRAVLAGWVLSLALLLLMGWAAVAWRADVMRAWPPSERAYGALGLAPATR